MGLETIPSAWAEVREVLALANVQFGAVGVELEREVVAA